MTGDHDVLGLDIGGARTKVVRARDGAAWEGSNPPAGHAAFLRALLGPRGALPAHRATAVVAAPDRWRIGRQSNPVPLGATAAGAQWVRALTEDAGLGSVRLVPGLQCVTAAEAHADPTPGCVLACDVGATTIDAAVYMWDGRTTRLLDAEHADVGSADPDSLLLDAAPEPADPAARLRWVADNRCANSDRIALVLRRAREQERYWDTPVCLAGRRAVTTARALDAALRPVAAAAAAVVRRLTNRIEDRPRPELVLTGGNALGPVVDAVRDATNGMVDGVRVVAPTTAATGAALIGQGRVVAADAYPHQLGVPARHVRAGLLGSVVLPLTTAGTLVVDVADDHRGPLPVAVRVEGRGPWRITVPTVPVAVPPGRHRVRAVLHRAGLGAVELRHEHSGAEITQLLAAEPSDAVAPDSTQEPR